MTRDEQAFGMLEVVVALVVLLLVLVAASQLLSVSVGVGADSRYKDQAVGVANSLLDEQAQVGAATLLGEVGDAPLAAGTYGTTTYQFEREVAVYAPNSTACVSPISNPEAMLQVTVWATWDHVRNGSQWWKAGSTGATGKLVRATRLVALPETLFNPNDGAILVQITGAEGEPVSGVAVTISSGGVPETADSTSSGCLFFPNLTPGTWSLSGTEAGYIDAADDWSTGTGSPAPVTATATVTAGGEQTISLTYDQAASVTARYYVAAPGGTVPTGLSLPLSFYNSQLTTNGGIDPYVAAVPALVYPFGSQPSYDVVAGSCGSQSAPDGATDGVPVSLVPGQAATVDIPLTALTVVVTKAGTPVSGAQVDAQATTGCPASGSTVMPSIHFPLTACSGTCTAAAVRPLPQAFLTAGFCNSTTSVSSNLDPSTFGQSVTLTVRVSDGSYGRRCRTTATGTVTLTDNGTTLKTLTLTNGQATYSTSSLPIGSDDIVASYGGDATFRASSGSATQTVNPGSTTTTTPTTTTTTAPYGSGTPEVQSGLPYGTFVLTAPGEGTAAVTVTVTPAGISVNGGAVQPPGSIVTVAD